MVFRTLVNSSKRVPLIKFRKGAAHQASSTTPTQTTQQTIQTPDEGASNVIEDWELPNRYKRRPITADEMEYINRGGPA